MGKEYSIDCGWHLRRFSLLYEHFAFIDTADYLADSLFIKHEVTVAFGPEYIKEGIHYNIIFCRCRKRDVPRFLKALEELPKKMMICGYADYPQFCKELKAAFMDTHRRMKGGDFLDPNGPLGKTEQTEAKRVS